MIVTLRGIRGIYPQLAVSVNHNTVSRSVHAHLLGDTHNISRIHQHNLDFSHLEHPDDDITVQTPTMSKCERTKYR